MLKNLRRTAAAVAACASTTFSAFGLQAAEPLKVGFVYVSPIGQAGWTYQHDQGRLAMERALGERVKTTVVEAVAEGADGERVMRELAATGHKLIFATSFGYQEGALRVAADYPGVKIEHAGGYKSAPNFKTYNARYYEARYLAGLLAGQTSKSGIAGYVAGFPVPEVIQGIDAFTLGMREANPKAQVRVLWLNSWFDPPREREAAVALVNAGADVLTNHSGSPAVAQAAEEKSVRVIAYQSDMRRFAPTAQLAAVTHHWGAYYTQVAQSVLDGSWSAMPVWGGMAQGLVRLEAIDPAVPPGVRERLEQRRADIVGGRLLPFTGRLVDNRGELRQAGGTMGDAQIATLDWFVDGVVGALPKP